MFNFLNDYKLFTCFKKNKYELIFKLVPTTFIRQNEFLRKNHAENQK